MSERRPSPDNLSCYGTARILVEDLGGPSVARIYELEIHIHGGDEEPLEHAFVICKDAKDSDDPLNAGVFADLGFKVRTIRRQGRDVTEKILKKPWSEL